MPTTTDDLVKLATVGLPDIVPDRERLAREVVDLFCEVYKQEPSPDDLSVVRIYRHNKEATSEKPANVIINFRKLLTGAPSAALTIAGATHSMTLLVLGLMCVLLQLHGIMKIQLAEDQAAIVAVLAEEGQTPSEDLLRRVNRKTDYPCGDKITSTRYEECLRHLSVLGVIEIKEDIVSLKDSVKVY